MGDNECDQCVIFCCLLPLIFGTISFTISTENPGWIVIFSFIIIVGIIINGQSKEKAEAEAEEPPQQKNEQRNPDIQRFFTIGNFPCKIESMRFFGTTSEAEWRKFRVRYDIRYDRSENGYYIPRTRPHPRPQMQSQQQPEPQPQPQQETNSGNELKKYCQYCGAALSMNARRCKYCNSPIS